MIVVDASVALAWCLADEADEYAERVLERVSREGAVAPAHWPMEVVNGLRSAERRGRLKPDELPRLGRLVADLGVQILPVELTTALLALDTAREHDLSVYDAVYLDLALFRNVPLATLDDRLARACEQAGGARAT